MELNVVKIKSTKNVQFCKLKIWILSPQLIAAFNRSLSAKCLIHSIGTITFKQHLSPGDLKRYLKTPQDWDLRKIKIHTDELPMFKWGRNIKNALLFLSKESLHSTHLFFLYRFYTKSNPDFPSASSRSLFLSHLNLGDLKRYRFWTYCKQIFMLV
jgi:hypothetical protein